MAPERGREHPSTQVPDPDEAPRYDLTGAAWTSRACPHGSGPPLAQAVSRTGTSPAGWLPATVPGLVTEDLLRAGRIADPYFADSTPADPTSGRRTIEEQDYVYLRRFILRPEDLESCPRARLVFDSVDTFATVFLNGVHVASHENQFRRLFIDVTDVLRTGDNWLAIALEASWPGTLRRAGPELPHRGGRWERIYVRKSQMSFGSVWTPAIPTVGLPGSVYLELSRGVFADALRLEGQLVGGGDGGSISGQAEYTPHETFEAEVALLVDGEERLREHVAFHAGHTQTLSLSDTLSKARRWYPHERGTPHLYAAELKVTREGRIIHALHGRVGIRNVELDLGTSDHPSFRLVVNGEPIFVKGENWVPMDLLHTRTTNAQLRNHLESLVAGGVNLLRVWGGGIFEREAFYDACDELGLLVWQDFPYAGAIYPANDAFLLEARREGEDIVRRLRSHASIALWCGGDEHATLAERYAPELLRHPLYDDVLRGVTSRLDPHRPYWPGSPNSVSPGEPPNSPREGDRHDWNTWYGWQDSASVQEASFCSAAGVQALPQRESLETFLPSHALDLVSDAPGSELNLLLTKHGAHLDKLIARSSDYAYPADLDTFIAASQAFQADVLHRLVQRHRYSQSGGVIVWNYTSSWPSVGWALIDWYGRPTQAFYAVRRAFAPLTLGLEAEDSGAERFTAHVSLDRKERFDGEVEVSLCDLVNGEPMCSERRRIHMKGPSGTAAASLDLPRTLDRRRFAVVATLTALSAEKLTRPRLQTLRYLAPHRELSAARRNSTETARRRNEPTLAAEWRGDTVQLVSSAWHVRVGVESYEPRVLWNDNYIDLLPGEERMLHVELGQPEHLWLVANFGQRVRLRRNQQLALPESTNRWAGR